MEQGLVLLTSENIQNNFQPNSGMDFCQNRENLLEK